MAEKYLHEIVYWIEIVVAVILVVLTILALFGLLLGVSGVLKETFALTPLHFSEVITLVLEVFILIELFRIAIAYMSHKNVIPTVLEAALVAVARKYVVLEPKENFLQYSAGLAILLVAVAISWWLLSHANACVNLERGN